MRIDNWECIEKMRDGQVYGFEDCLAYYENGRYYYQNPSGNIRFLGNAWTWDSWCPTNEIPIMRTWDFQETKFPAWWDGRPVWGEFVGNYGMLENGYLVHIDNDDRPYRNDNGCWYENFKPLPKEPEKKSVTYNVIPEQDKKIKEILENG